ncbi:MAG: class I SAM-dependent methyltransferase [Chloroflexi bacterium]|nr:class I SAM-dependent methyltransferase [Chloroflexota bacterium]
MTNNHNDFDSFYASSEWYYQTEPSEELKEYIDSSTYIKDTESASSLVALDLGCGEGRDSVFLSRCGYRVIAVDKSPVGIQKLGTYAQAHGLSITGVVADVTSFHISQDSYDLINAVTILDHLDVEANIRLAHAIVQGLKPSGVLFAEVFTTDDPGYISSTESSETANFVKHYFRKGELKELFSTLEIVRYEEKLELDTSHGLPHHHGVAIILAKKALR